MNTYHKQEEKRTGSSLFFRTYVSFAVMITIFAVSLGVVYLRMYDKRTINSSTSDLKQKAESIASRCSSYFISRDTQNWGSFFSALYEIEKFEILVMPESSAQFPLDGPFISSVGTSVNEDTLIQTLKTECMKTKQTSIRIDYSAVHDCKQIAVATPVYGYNGEVAGTLFAFFPLQDEKEIVKSATSMIIISSVAAIIIAFLIAIPFASAISAPISSITRTALQLARGNYETKTEIQRKDEVGELAKAMDFLSDKLCSNEKERRNNEQMRLDFFANVSHELRTPITVMKAYTESLADGVVSDEKKVKQYYSRMSEECNAMERLVGDLLILSKMQNPDFAIEKEPVNLQQVFSDIMRSGTAIAEKKGITIKLDTDDEPCIMNGDYARLRQMFMVILDNAIKFSNEGGTIYLGLHTDTKITASIRDEGIGIDENELPFIFDKFYKSKLRQNAKGSGLGLSIAKYICLKHDGEIRIDSKKGEGTCFYFIFNPETKVRKRASSKKSGNKTAG